MLYNKDWAKKPVELKPWQVHFALAADCIEQHGWCQHTAQNSKGQFCTVGAIEHVIRPPDSCYPPSAADKVSLNLAAIALVQHLDVSHGGGGALSAVTRWNDRAGRTKEQVINTLRQAAKG